MLQSIPLDKLKFCDEAHFVTQLNKKKVLCVIGQWKYIPNNTLHSKLASLTLLTSISEPIFFDFHEESNTQYDHLDFVFSALSHGVLNTDDYMVDNMTVHGGTETLPHLHALLQAQCGTCVLTEIFT